MLCACPFSPWLWTPQTRRVPALGLLKKLPWGQVSKHNTGNPAWQRGPWALRGHSTQGFRLCVRPAPAYPPVMLVYQRMEPAGAAPQCGDVPARCRMLCPGNKRAWQRPALVTVPCRNEAGAGEQLARPGASRRAGWPRGHRTAPQGPDHRDGATASTSAAWVGTEPQQLVWCQAGPRGDAGVGCSHAVLGDCSCPWMWLGKQRGGLG